jgi:deazaflavin-dependent oxidoreductase (nitroreductase family)
LIRHLIAPVDRWLYKVTGGRALSTGLREGPVLLLTTTGRRTGKLHTTPVFYLRDTERLVICSVNPRSERSSPWMLNLRAHSIARVQVGRQVASYHAREASSEEIDRYWPRLVEIWPPYEVHYAGGGHRAVFVLEPTGASG